MTALLSAVRHWWHERKTQLSIAQAENRARANAAGYCTCPAGEMGAVSGEEHDSWCARYES